MMSLTKCDLYMVLDVVTGKPERFGDNLNSMGTKLEAIKYLESRGSWIDRLVIVKLDCNIGFITIPIGE